MTHPEPAPGSPLALYQQWVAQGTISADPGQARVVEALQRHYERLCGVAAPHPNPLPKERERASGSAAENGKALSLGRGLGEGHTLSTKKQGIISLLTSLFQKPPPPPPLAAGAYIWGDVGRGKSMIMDLFYDSITGIPKKRVHFHAFMRDVHARMHAWRQLKTDVDLLPRVVQEMAQGFRLLCFDELQVHDITDAMILSRLFTQLFEMGITVIFTSNRPPSDLYLGGIQRELFTPFIDLVKQRMEVLKLESPTDYRLAQLKAMKQTYLHPTGLWAELELYDIYCALTQQRDSIPVRLDIQGRTLLIEKAANGVGWLTFQELCERPLGAGDYLELANAFHTLIVQDIPILSPEKRNEAKRFVTLIDALYEHNVKFICSAAAAPDALYPSGDGSFEFQRTVSRLMEMQSENYLAAGHVVG